MKTHVPPKKQKKCLEPIQSSMEFMTTKFLKRLITGLHVFSKFGYDFYWHQDPENKFIGVFGRFYFSFNENGMFSFCRKM